MTPDKDALIEELVSIAKRWAALDGGSWHPERYMQDRNELITDTRSVLAKATAPVVAGREDDQL